MAKTRSQTKKQPIVNVENTHKKSATKKSKSRMGQSNLFKAKSTVTKLISERKKNMLCQTLPVMKECRVRLTRIDLSKINLICPTEKGIDKSKENAHVELSKSYDLRKRTQKATVEIQIKKSKSVQQLVACSQAALYTSRAARLWELLKKENPHRNHPIKIDDIVCARMAGHRPWPAQITSFPRNGVQLKFFGTHDIGCVKKLEIIPYKFCQHVLEEYLKVPTTDLCTKTLMYHLSFLKGVKEVSCHV